MGKTTISVETNTHSRFISNKGSFEAVKGRSVESDEFLNELLTVYERVQQLAEAALKAGEDSVDNVATSHLAKDAEMGVVK